MILLVANLCLLAAPGTCHDEFVSMLESKMECSVVAMQRLPTWVQQYPAYRLNGWRCDFVLTKRSNI